jgi:hypothetical protein
MANQNDIAAPAGLQGALARPDWRAGGTFNASELRLAHEYQVQRLRRHLRLAHAWGVVCGLTIVAAPDGDGADLILCPGYGIGPCGDEILVPDRVRFSLQDYLWTRPVGNAGGRIWIGIEAAQQVAAYAAAPAQPCGCCCGGTEEMAAILVDGFRILVWWTQPAEASAGFDMCGGAAPPCPICPACCGLPLASLNLPATLRGVG